MRTLADGEKVGEHLTSSLGVSQDVLKTLRAKLAEEILKAGNEQVTRALVDG